MMNKIVTGLLSLHMLLATAQAQNTEPPKPYGPLPSKHQVAWQQMEYYMFIHFGPNTFTNKEWGHGDEDPKVFNPTQLDAEQWARTAKAAGMKGIIITAKHHDGFCLWPSKYSTHTVRESAWKNGEGDVLKELSDACKKYNLKFGVYLSPWDRNHPAYGTPEYNTIFANTLNEVLTGYGPVFEQWFDGANGEAANGKRQVYDWPLFHSVVYKNQPQAIIFSDVGPGCRWVGNESGYAGATNWSTLNIAGFEPGAAAPPTSVLNTGNEDGSSWVPAEADVSIRPGWFYSPETDDKVKSIHHLLDIYYNSVGRNANLLLNVPVDRRGLIHKNDSLRLMEFKHIIDKSFEDNLAKGKRVTATNTRGNAAEFNPMQITDNNYNTYWSTNDGVTTASFTVELQKVTEINRVLLQEYIPLGQRVQSFSVEYWTGNGFKELDKQTTIGYKRILTFPAIKTSRVRVNILSSKASPVISEVQLYKAPELLSVPVIARDKKGTVTLKAEGVDAVIVFTTDGKEPVYTSTRYTKPFLLAGGGVVKAKTFIEGGKKSSETITTSFDIASDKWQVVAPTKAAATAKMIDGNAASFWLSTNTNSLENVVIDLAETVSVKGFRYTPRQDGKTEGIIYQYNFYVSNNGKQWTKVASNKTFDNIKNNPVSQKVLFGKTYPARFIKLEPLSVVNTNDTFISIAEIEVITK